MYSSGNPSTVMTRVSPHPGRVETAHLEQPAVPLVQHLAPHVLRAPVLPVLARRLRGSALLSHQLTVKVASFGCMSCWFETHTFHASPPMSTVDANLLNAPTALSIDGSSE